MNPFSLTGKTALVTGANAGIGQAIALAMGDAGARVICAGRSSCDETAAQIADAETLTLDFANPMAGQDIFADRDVDILVNNAGIIRRDESADFSEADWDDVMDVNLKALFFTTQAFGRARLAQGKEGRVINIASLLSFQGGIRVPSYTASKHGVAGLTKILANEWSAKGIGVNAIAPGYIATANTTALRQDPKRNAEILSRIPCGRWGEPDDIAHTAVFLAAPASRYLHGAIINVDGGWLAR